MEERIDWCDHCGNRTPQRLVHRQDFTPRAWQEDADGAVQEATDSFAGAHFIAVCGTCQQVLVYADYQGRPEDLRFSRAELQWPEPPDLHDSVPDAVASVYLEAKRVSKISPSAFAVFIGRALEAICDDRGVKKAPLAQQLSELSARGEIPPKLAELTTVLRLLRNLSAHASGVTITEPDVWALDVFFKAIVEYVYVAPGRLADYRRRLDYLTGSP